MPKRVAGAPSGHGRSRSSGDRFATIALAGARRAASGEPAERASATGPCRPALVAKFGSVRSKPHGWIPPCPEHPLRIGPFSTSALVLPFTVATSGRVPAGGAARRLGSPTGADLRSAGSRTVHRHVRPRPPASPSTATSPEASNAAPAPAAVAVCQAGSTAQLVGAQLSPRAGCVARGPSALVCWLGDSGAYRELRPEPSIRVAP